MEANFPHLPQEKHEARSKKEIIQTFKQNVRQSMMP
jgi:hypothetical protein